MYFRKIVYTKLPGRGDSGDRVAQFGVVCCGDLKTPMVRCTYNEGT